MPATQTKPLSIRKANRLAKGRAMVSPALDGSKLWHVARPGSVQYHAPMTRKVWLGFLRTGVVRV
jgi:hypothetical protein